MTYRFVDCGFDLVEPETARERYLEGHIPGAVFLSLEHDLADHDASGPGRHPMPGTKAFAATASRAGIGPDTFVVAYDHGSLGGAARLWWLLRHNGHERVSVLRGGIEAWRGPLATGEESAAAATFVPSERIGDTITADELQARLGEPGLVVVDARAPERYRGEVEPIDPVAGHIPGAINWPHAVADPQDVPARIAQAAEVIIYCGSGVTACVDVLALHEAGRTDVKLYPGSWSDWSSRGLAAETGPGGTA